MSENEWLVMYFKEIGFTNCDPFWLHEGNSYKSNRIRFVSKGTGNPVTMPKKSNTHKDGLISLDKVFWLRALLFVRGPFSVLFAQKLTDSNKSSC